MNSVPQSLGWSANLDPGLTSDLRQQAARIRSRIAKTTEAIVETGRDLLAAKDQLEHGEFSAWVEEEVGIRIRSAQLYMSAARFMAGKNETVSLLPPSTIYKLAAKSTPPELAAEIIARVTSGEVVPEHEIAARLCDARQERLKEKKGKRAAEARTDAPRHGREWQEQQIEWETRERLEEAEAKQIALEICNEIGPTRAKFVFEQFRRCKHHKQWTTIIENLADQSPIDIATEPKPEPYPDLPDFLDRRAAK
jgi:Protein of unknown function (DUF3102)